MTYDELIKYWIPAAKNLISDARCPKGGGHDAPGYSDRGHWQFYMLDDLLGVHEYEFGYYKRRISMSVSRHAPMPEELKNLLIMLAGPHGHALLKAYRIRKGLEP